MQPARNSSAARKSGRVRIRRVSRPQSFKSMVYTAYCAPGMANSQFAKADFASETSASSA